MLEGSGRTLTRESILRRDWRPFASIVAISLLAWGALFITPQAVFWDDWVIIGDDTLRMTSELGLPWVGYLFNALTAAGPWAFKAMVLASTIAVGWLTYLIAGRGLGLSRAERWLLAALVVALPLFAVRMVAAVSQYSLSVALFFLGWWLLVRKRPDEQGRLRYVIAALPLFASYTTASLLPFTALPVLHLAYLAIPRTRGWLRNIARFVLRFWYIFATPIVFWIVRALFLQPYGAYADYNAIGYRSQRYNLVVTFVVFVWVLLALLWWLLGLRARRKGGTRTVPLLLLAVATGAMAVFLFITRISTAPIGWVVPVTLVLCALVFIVAAIVNAVASRGAPGSRDPWLVPMLAIGLLSLIGAIVPYLLVGKVPSYQDWETRHQLLMPSGVAVIIVAAMRALAGFVSSLVVRILSIALVGAFAAISFVLTLGLVVDWHKQMQVSAALADEPLVRNTSTVLFVDSAPRFNYNGRSYSFYEYNGWMWTSLGDQSRLGLDPTSLPVLFKGDMDLAIKLSSRYGFGDYTPSTNGALVEILPTADASWWTLLLDQKSITLRVSPIEDLAAFEG